MCLLAEVNPRTESLCSHVSAFSSCRASRPTFPEAFETFSSFRKFFPTVSSYCFCSDSRGRELDNTGVELLLSEVYDSAFSGLRSGRSFSQTNIYRVLRRRMLGVRLALTGHFRCPSPCEEERRAAMEASSVFVPSCETGGAFASRQCQQGGQCWCVDPTGRELPGTRQQGDTPVCSSGLADCPSRRRLALSRLFSGPVDPPILASSGRSPASCLPSSVLSWSSCRWRRIRPPSCLSWSKSSTVSSPRWAGLCRLWLAPPPVASRRTCSEGSSGSGGPAFLSALQQTLRELSSSQSLDQVLAPLLRSCSGDGEEDTAAVFVPSCTSSGGFQEVQCLGGECWCVDAQGQEVAGSRVVGRRPRCPSRCERERAMALKVKGKLAAGAEIHVPACSEDGDFLPLQCVGPRCFCVDAEGRTVSAGPAGGAVTCKISLLTNISCHSC
ncbi:thyroglobulin-like [Micropterus salmoides]|uniref:thyroglobulin-like n=1 Tax=Micropterus salmoides TaxID=27706 RepID=UPI0018EBCB25|nr:thyroglobulin-like [Micropterus salmoides]